MASPPICSETLGAMRMTSKGGCVIVVGDPRVTGCSVMVAAGVWSAFLHCRPLWEFLRRISRRCAELLTLGSDSDCGAAEKDA